MIRLLRWKIKRRLGKFNPNSIKNTYWYHEFTLLGFSVASVLMGVFIAFAVRSDFQYRWVHWESLAVEAFLILLLSSWNVWLLHRDLFNNRSELLDKIKDLLAQLKEAPVGSSEIRVPYSASLSCYRVIRNGKEQLIHSSLLVKDDLIFMAIGDKAPGMVLLRQGTSEERFLDAGQILHPEFFSHEELQSKNRFQFQLIETPILRIIDIFLDKKSPESILRKHAYSIARVVSYHAWTFAIITSIAGIIHFALSPKKFISWLYFIVIPPVYVILAILPLNSMSFWVFARAWGNTKISVLFEQLQQSTTPFDDSAEVDEFDEEAPAPTKKVLMNASQLFRRFWGLLVSGEKKHIRSTSLLESLSSVTVICSLDREASLTVPFPALEQIGFLSKNYEETLVLDVDENSKYVFEDNDWKEYIASLKPFGLDLLLNTDCRMVKSKRRKHENHCKRRNLFRYAPRSAARQRCLCHMSEKIGFSEDMLRSFAKGTTVLITKEFSRNEANVSALYETPSIDFQILSDPQGEIMVLAEGNVNMLLEFCVDYWDGSDLVDLTAEKRQKIVDFLSTSTVNDGYCIAYSYCPLISLEPGIRDTLLSKGKSIVINQKNDIDSMSKEDREIIDILKIQTFLCLAAYYYVPKEDVKEFIEDLRFAGIRFVYFSDTPERESKAFAKRLGLETDWNSCILLSSKSDSGNQHDYTEEHDIKAKLPRGIEEIRPHLKKVDDIPLLVSLFADCNSINIEEMIRIFQENGDTVCCLGNSLNSENPALFAAANVAISIDPFPIRNSAEGKLTNFGMASCLNSLPAMLSMSYETSPYALNQTICEARTYLMHLTQAFAFILACQMCLCLIVSLNSLLLLPPVLTGYQILWISLLVAPLIGLSFLFSTGPSLDVMKIMPLKSSHVGKDIGRFMRYFFYRFGPIAILVIVTHIIVLINLAPINPWDILAEAHMDWAIQGSEYNKVLIASQAFASMTLLIYLVFVSSTFLFRINHIFENVPFKNYVWTSICCVLIPVHLAWSLTIISASIGRQKMMSISWIFGIIFGCLVPIILINELVKSSDKKEFKRFQKRIKLEFNTKLGCYSPV